MSVLCIYHKLVVRNCNIACTFTSVQWDDEVQISRNLLDEWLFSEKIDPTCNQ